MSTPSARSGARVVLLNKPYRVLSERAGAPGQVTVSELVPIPKLDPAGRLDFDSEGLVILTDDGALQHRIIHPRHKVAKVYWVQVEGAPTPEAVRQLAEGIVLADGPTRPARVRRMAPPPLWPRDPPVQERRDLPSSWLEIVLTEGRKRQVRRMTAAVGHPTLRLVRVAVGPWRLGELKPGEWREARPSEMEDVRG
jgi:23S rRNA pseudouridine2457 synthase